LFAVISQSIDVMPITSKSRSINGGGSEGDSATNTMAAAPWSPTTSTANTASQTTGEDAGALLTNRSFARSNAGLRSRSRLTSAPATAFATSSCPPGAWSMESLPARDDATTVRSYKSLALVERAFRCLKTVDLQIRPVYHWLADRVRAHVLLCHPLIVVTRPTATQRRAFQLLGVSCSQ
jgi:hypothetical protein